MGPLSFIPKCRDAACDWADASGRVGSGSSSWAAARELEVRGHLCIMTLLDAAGRGHTRPQDDPLARGTIRPRQILLNVAQINQRNAQPQFHERFEFRTPTKTKSQNAA